MTRKNKKSFREKLEIFNLIMNVILTPLTITLSIYAINAVMEVKGMSDLNNKLSKQLKINQDIQNASIRNAELARRSNKNKLRAACNMIDFEIKLLESQVFELQYDLALERVRLLLENQLDNAFLMESDSLSSIWVKNQAQVISAISMFTLRHEQMEGQDYSFLKHSIVPDLKQVIAQTNSYTK